MAKRRYSLLARVSTDNPAAVKHVLDGLIPVGSVTTAEGGKELIVKAQLQGESAKDLNRSLLSAMRRVERRTRLRAEWTSEGITERFFDYVSKGTRKAEAGRRTI